MGDGKVLEKMGERRKYVRRDATVERLSAIFLEDMEGSVKPSTLACYRRNIQCHILPALGECVAAELTAAEINDFIQQLQEDYSPKLVREIGGLLLRIVGMAGVGYGEDVTLPKVRQKAVEVFTEPELKQMGQVILRRPDRTGLGVLLTAYTGLRLSVRNFPFSVAAPSGTSRRLSARCAPPSAGCAAVPRRRPRPPRGRCNTAIRCCWSAAVCGIGISIACGTATPRGVWSGGWT